MDHLVKFFRDRPRLTRVTVIVTGEVIERSDVMQKEWEWRHFCPLARDYKEHPVVVIGSP